MEQLVLFRKRIDSLNTEEYQQCIKSFLEQCTTSFDRHSILKILFNTLHEEINNNKINNVNKMNDIITEIIASRNIYAVTKEEDDFNHEIINNNNLNALEIDNKKICLKLCDIPSDLLFNISSYLTFKEILQFETCNRSIFIGARSSKSPISSINPNEFIKLVAFCQNNELYAERSKRFKSISLDCSDLVECENDINSDEYLSIKGLTYKWNNLVFKYIKTLEIECESNSEIKEILLHLKDCKDLSNIRTLKLHHGDAPDSVIHNLLLTIIKTKLNLEYFEYLVHNLEDVSLFELEWVSKLKGIAVNDGNANDNKMKMYSFLGNKLQSFHNKASKITEDINGKLDMVKELCLSLWYFKCEIEILLKQNWITLKRLHLIDADYIGIDDDENIKTLTQLLMNKLVQSVEYLCLDRIEEDGCSEILNILTQSLKHHNGYQLKIRINAMSGEDVNIIVKHLDSLIKALSTTCSNWMFILKELIIPGTSGVILDFLLETMKQIYCVRVKKHTKKLYIEDYYEYTIEINNNGCNINGYHENWIMSCDSCRQTVICD
eukprot:229307_1